MNSIMIQANNNNNPTSAEQFLLVFFKYSFLIKR